MRLLCLFVDESGRSPGRISRGPVFIIVEALSVYHCIDPAGSASAIVFADKLTLVGIAKIGNEDIVTLLNKESLERISISSNLNPQGLKIVSVELNTDPLKACVTIKKGDEIAKVQFDKTLAEGGKASSTPGNNAATPPIPSGIARPMVIQPHAPISERVVRIVSPVPYSGQASGGNQLLPPRPGS